MFRLALLLHLFGAAIWIGGHLVLVLGILPRALREERRRTSAADRTAGLFRVLAFEEAFARPGLIALAMQVVTGLYLATVYLGGWEGWRRALRFADDAPPTADSILLKIALLIATGLLGGHAYHRVLPGLKRAAELASGTGGSATQPTRSGTPESTLRALRRFALHASLATLFAIALLFVGASIRFGGLF